MVSIPFGVLTAVFIAEVAPRWAREILKPLVELLAGLPSGALGFVGILVVTPLVRTALDLPTGLTAFTGALLLGLIAIPTIVSVTEDALDAVPRTYREAALAMGAPLPAFAQQADASSGIEEIVVTAQRREENLQDVGIAVTALGGEMLTDLNITTATDITRAVPSLKMNAYSSSQVVFNIRGVSQNDYGDQQEPPVAVYQDDSYASSINVASFPIFDLARVEVLRGPQGTVFCYDDREVSNNMGLKPGANPTNLAEAGWGVILTHDADPAIKEALSLLLEHRRQQAAQRLETVGLRAVHVLAAAKMRLQHREVAGLEFVHPGLVRGAQQVGCQPRRARIMTQLTVGVERPDQAEIRFQRSRQRAVVPQPGDAVQPFRLSCRRLRVQPVLPDAGVCVEVETTQSWEFEDWDSNGDDIFARMTGFPKQSHKLDLVPDVYYGRLACMNKFEVKTMVNKIITYESTS